MLALVLPISGSASLGIVQPVLGQSVVSSIVTNPLTGIALDGYDPVSYFTENEPLMGSSDFEYDWSGVPWYFATAANRDVFVGNPEIYCPQYGGHGAMSAARGFVSDGNPKIYTVFKQRLYLFYSAANRDAFLLSPDEAAASGAKNWPALVQTLTHN
ncbi:YHS domain-containing (seleno)protein [Devosia sp.]|uniref:YHS domain-containing (seleno)protein n=1 Tax=Devosia sp. TaxID=1871048 RepID=UPI0032676B59